MLPDLTPIFSRYEGLRAEADRLFAKIATSHPDCVVCRKGCGDCCHALFDLSLVEAMYVHQAFGAAFDYGAERSAILSRAAETDRRLARLKRDLYRSEKDGEDVSSLLERTAQMRMRCPLLADDDFCLLYEARPVTCRLYGVPAVIAGKSHVCGLSAFAKGVAYPAVQLDRIQARLEDLSLDLATAVGSRFSELHKVYVPMSMALLTNYDEKYLGVGQMTEE